MIKIDIFLPSLPWTANQFPEQNEIASGSPEPQLNYARAHDVQMFHNHKVVPENAYPAACLLEPAPAPPLSSSRFYTLPHEPYHWENPDYVLKLRQHLPPDESVLEPV